MLEEIGRYQLHEKIGEGGFAIVYRGWDTELDRVVALKELRPAYLTDEEGVRRFQQEAKTIARLDHPHIVTVYDVYHHQKRLFIVMRLVEGRSLDKVIVEQRGLDWGRAVEIITAIGRGLDYAHLKGTLHRDMKPANILLDAERGPMLSDFGLAKLTLEGSARTSNTGTVVGTPHYIAPEVWEGKPFTPQADIYALGCIMYEMLIGEPIFKGNTPPAVMMAHFKQPELPLRWPKGVPAQIGEVIMKALTKTPSGRHETARQFAEAIANLNTPNSTTLPLTPQRETMGLYKIHTDESKPTDDDPLFESGVTQVLSTKSNFETMPPPTEQRAVTDTSTTTEIVAEHHKLMERIAQLEATIRQQSSDHVTVSATPPSASETVADRQDRDKHWFKRGKISCLATTLLTTIGLLLTVFLGLNTICRWTDSVVTQLLPPVLVGEVITQSISIPVPAISQALETHVSFRHGLLVINPHEADAPLLQGNVTYNATEFQPAIRTQPNLVEIRPNADVGLSGYTTQGIINEWYLTIGHVPMSLEIRAQGAESEIELGDLAITGLDISNDLGTMSLFFSEPNRVEMSRFLFDGGGSEAELFGLINSRADLFDIKVGASDYLFDFSGELERDVRVEIDGGLSRVTIVVPESTTASLTIDTDTSDVRISGAWAKTTATEFVQPGEGDYSIQLDISLDSGTIRLRN